MRLKQNRQGATFEPPSQAARGGYRKSRRGLPFAAYTLAEVMVAVFVLAIIGLAYYGALSSGFGVVQSTREDLRATQIMMQKLEAVRLCTWSELANVQFREAYDPMSTNNTGVVYFGTVAMAPASSLDNDPSYKPNMRQVTVTVTWTNYNGSHTAAHSRQMQTQVARYGLQNYIWGSL